MSLKRLRSWLIGLPVDQKKMRADIREHLGPIRSKAPGDPVEEFIQKAKAEHERAYEEARVKRTQYRRDALDPHQRST